MLSYWLEDQFPHASKSLVPGRSAGVATKPMKHAAQVMGSLMSLMREELLEAACDPVFVSCRCYSEAMLSGRSCFKVHETFSSGPIHDLGREVRHHQ